MSKLYHNSGANASGNFDRPGYYAVIPAGVRYDDRLPPNAKLLYGEITALATAKGYCYASNEYFCQLYGLSERAISRLFGALESSGYIRREVERDKDGTVTSRKIWITVSAVGAHPVDNFVTPSRQFCQDPPDKIVQGSNTEEHISNTQAQKDKPEKIKLTLTAEQMEEQIDQCVAALAKNSHWTDTERDAVGKLVREFYGPRAIDGKPPKHTSRGVNGLFRKMAPQGRCTAQDALDMLLTAIERGWTSVYPRVEKGRAPAAPVPPSRGVEGLGESW